MIHDLKFICMMLILIIALFLGILGIGYIKSIANNPVSYSPLRTWTAPVDSSSLVTEYDLRYSSDSMDLINDWQNCIQIQNEPFPASPGSAESLLVNLPVGTWYFGIKSVDAAGNWSDLSNIAQVIIDSTGPVKIVNLR